MGVGRRGLVGKVERLHEDLMEAGDWGCQEVLVCIGVLCGRGDRVDDKPCLRSMKGGEAVVTDT